jgi:Alternative complex III, ActD subunit
MSTASQLEPTAQRLAVYGAVAEFDSPERLLAAIRGARERGYARLDAFTPFPVHGIDEALGAPRSPLGWIVLAAGLAGAAAALLLIWWTGAVNYPLVIAGKPLFAFEFSIPITFELAVLFAAFGAVIGMFLFNGLPRLYHPVFQHSRFERATDDRFLLAIEADSLDFDPARAAAALSALGGEHVEVVAE